MNKLISTKIKRGDNVVVTVGKDRGREGKVERVLRDSGKVLIPGINQFKKHVKPRGETKGEIATLSRPLTIANVALICPKCKKPTRVGYKMDLKKKVRFCRKCKERID